MLKCHAACSAGAAVELGIEAEPPLDLVGLCDDAPYDVDRGLDEDLLLDLRRNHLPPKHSATQSCASLILCATIGCVIAIRSEERRVGKECRFRWWRDDE